MLQTLLQQNLGGAWGPADANTVYAFFYPEGSIGDDGFGDKCCTDLDGYHSDVVVGGGIDVAYSVVCTCPGFDPGGTDLDQITVAASHELVEAATDPTFTNPGYAQTDDDHAIWTVATDGEAADLCQYADTWLWHPADMKYGVQRSYSTAAAAMGHDPCVGDPSEPYYQTIAEQPDAITIDYFGPWPTKGVKMAIGEMKSIKLHLYADAASGPFTVRVDDYSSTWWGGTAYVEATQPTGTFNPGEDLEVMIHVLDFDPTLGSAAAFTVTTIPVGDGPSTFSLGVVGQ